MKEERNGERKMMESYGDMTVTIKERERERERESEERDINILWVSERKKKFKKLNFFLMCARDMKISCPAQNLESFSFKTAPITYFYF
jgi:hypothetical protein